MSIYYSLISGPDGAVLTVSGDVSASITSDASTYADAVAYLSSERPEDLDPDIVRSLVDPRTAVESYITRVSDRVSFRGGELLFDGDAVNNSLASTIIRLAAEDESGDPTKLIKFLENLMNNPSEHSREQLYDWIAPRNITITNDGHFLAYKGLREDFTSINAGPGIVNNVSYTDHTHLDNSPGNIVEFSRSRVVANSAIGCAVGLHAGTHSYASSFAQGKLVLVKINPRDVVSVPTDCDAQKLRVCRYEVLEEIKEEVASVLWTHGDDVDSFDGGTDLYAVEDDEDSWGPDEDDWDEDEDFDDWDSDLYGDEVEDEDDEDGTDDGDDPYRHLRSLL